MLMVVSSLATGSTLMAVGLVRGYPWRVLDAVRGAPPFIEARQNRVPGADALAGEQL